MNNAVTRYIKQFVPMHPERISKMGKAIGWDGNELYHWLRGERPNPSLAYMERISRYLSRGNPEFEPIRFDQLIEGVNKRD